MRKTIFLKTDPGARSGFGLIELLLAMAMIMLLFLGAAHMLLFSIQTGVRCRDGAAALEIAVSRMESLKAEPFDSPLLNPGESSEEIDGPREPARFDLRLSIEDRADGLKLIKIRCEPINHPRKAADLAVYKSRDLGF